MSENTFKLNDGSPISLIGEFSAPAVAQTENYWGPGSTVMPAQVQSVVHSGQAIVSARAVVSAFAVAVRKMSLGISCQASVVMGVEVNYKGVASVVASSAVSGSAKKVNRGSIVIQAMSTVAALGKIVGNEIAISLGGIGAVLTAQSVFKGSFSNASSISISMSASMQYPILVTGASSEQSYSRSDQKFMGAQNKIFKSVWREAPADDEDEDNKPKKRGVMKSRDHARR